MSPKQRTLLIAALVVSGCAEHQTKPVEHPTFYTATHKLKITFVDVKEGDAILIQLDGTNLLLDTGRPGGCTNLLHVLDSLHIKTLFLTHPHLDHFGCGRDVLDRANAQVDEVITNGETRGPPRDPLSDPQPAWDQFVSTVTSHQKSLGHLQVGDTIHPAPGLTMTVLSTGSPQGGEFPDRPDGTDINNDSLTFMLEFGGKRVLLTGDVENAGDKLLIDRHCGGKHGECAALHADVLKVPHHGSASFEVSLFEAVKPTWAVISADYNFSNHHLPRAESIEALQQLGVTVFSTSAEGTENVVLEIDSTGKVTWTHPSNPIFAWTKDHTPQMFPQ